MQSIKHKLFYACAAAFSFVASGCTCIVPSSAPIKLSDITETNTDISVIEKVITSLGYTKEPISTESPSRLDDTKSPYGHVSFQSVQPRRLLAFISTKNPSIHISVIRYGIAGKSDFEYLEYTPIEIEVLTAQACGSKLPTSFHAERNEIRDALRQSFGPSRQIN